MSLGDGFRDEFQKRLFKENGNRNSIGRPGQTARIKPTPPASAVKFVPSSSAWGA
jgi:hypothetical protein